MKRDTKKLKYGANSLLMTVLVIAILVFVALISYDNSRQFDFTKDKKYTLSEQTQKVLKEFKGPVKAVCFFVEGNALRNPYRDQLELYKRASKNFDYELIDPNKKPGLAEKYKIAFNGETVFEYEGRQQRIRDVSEEAVTNALIKVATVRQKTVYFTVGHDERKLESEEESGLSFLKRYLLNEGYTPKEIKLFETEEMPKDITALAIVGAQKDFYPRELELLQNYAAQGGAVMVFLNPEKASDIAEFLGKTGIEVGNDMIVDKVSKMLGGDYFTPLVSGYGEHEITRDFGATLQFSLSRSVRKAIQAPEGANLTELCYTGNGAWAETNLSRLHEKGEVQLEPTDIAGPVSLGVAALLEKPGALFGVAETGRKTRMLVFGNADFISNVLIGAGGNLNFILNSFNWLLEDESRISLERTADEKTADVILLTSVEAMAILFFSIFFIPFLALVVGVAVYVKRKNMQ